MRWCMAGEQHDLLFNVITPWLYGFRSSHFELYRGFRSRFGLGLDSYSYFGLGFVSFDSRLYIIPELDPPKSNFSFHKPQTQFY